MGLFPRRSPAPSCAGRQTLFRPQPVFRRRLLHTSPAGIFYPSRRRGRAGKNFLRKRVCFLTADDADSADCFLGEPESFFETRTPRDPPFCNDFSTRGQANASPELRGDTKSLPLVQKN